MEFGTFFGIGIGKLAAVSFAALMFSYLYNWLVAWLERDGRASGYTSILVVGGNLVTLILASILIGVPAALWTFYLFALTGFFMVVGSFYRHTEQRKAEAEHIDRLLAQMRQDADMSRDILDELTALRRQLGESHDGA